jgi:hypothetical protein
MKDSFVYIWHNISNGRKYVGYHKGTLDDGYICSSSNDNFWKDFDYDEFTREIVFEGTQEECLKYEQHYLKSIDISSDEWYNNARGAEIIFTQEVKDKIRNHHLGKPSGMLGKKHSEESKKKVSITLKSIHHTDDWNKKVSIALKGKKKSDTHIENMRDSHGNKNVYKFFNIKTKELFEGTHKDFSIKFNIARFNVNSLIHKKTKILGGTWILEND